MNKEEVGVYVKLGMENYQKKNYDLAIKNFTQAIQLGSGLDATDKAFFYYLRNFAYFYKGNLVHAIEDLELAVKFCPENNDYQKTLAAAKSEMNSIREKQKVKCTYANGVVYEGDWVGGNPTGFFYDLARLNALEKFVIPKLIEIKSYKKDDSDRTIKIWSLDYTTGEEPYTIAMLLSEVLPPFWQFNIMASNLSTKCLAIAKEGFYENSKIEEIPDNYLAKYFNKVDGGYKVRPDLQSKINFVHHNLNNSFDQQKFDIVFCRNIITYLDEASKTAVIKYFCWDTMASKSFLFIGESESLFGFNTNFEFVKTQWGTLYRKFI
jgi:chemotaxis protein methyltransferase CheR